MIEMYYPGCTAILTMVNEILQNGGGRENATKNMQEERERERRIRTREHKPPTEPAVSDKGIFAPLVRSLRSTQIDTPAAGF